MEGIEEIKIESIEDYLKTIRQIQDEWSQKNNIANIIHRGDAKGNLLLPGVFRKRSDGKELKEFLIINQFLKKYKNFTSERFDSSLNELFSYMQHYGVPTRILDWTESSLVALYFALENIDSDKEPVVWVMNSTKLNELSYGNGINGLVLDDNILINARFHLAQYSDFNENKVSLKQFYAKDPNYKKKYWSKELDYPIAYSPFSSGNDRIIAQKGIFTIHGKDKRSIEEIFEANHMNEYLKKILLNKSKTKEIKNDLYTIGITPTTVYPDLYGLSKELRGDLFYYN